MLGHPFLFKAHKGLFLPPILAFIVALTGCGEKPEAPDKQAMIDQGRYLARIAGCNDCHTPGYAFSGGTTPESEWLTGDALGWRGPWGTTYPSNLRLYIQNFSEDAWLKLARNTQFRPPMPWFALRDMSDDDLKSLYHYMKHLGPAGQPAPAFVPPDQKPAGPFVLFPAPPPQE